MKDYQKLKPIKANCYIDLKSPKLFWYNIAPSRMPKNVAVVLGRDYVPVLITPIPPKKKGK